MKTIGYGALGPRSRLSAFAFDRRALRANDVLIEIEEGRKFSLVDLVGVQHTLGDAIGLDVTAIMRRSISPRLRRTIESDVVDVF